MKRLIALVVMMASVTCLSAHSLDDVRATVQRVMQEHGHTQQSKAIPKGNATLTIGGCSITLAQALLWGTAAARLGLLCTGADGSAVDILFQSAAAWVMQQDLFDSLARRENITKEGDSFRTDILLTLGATGLVASLLLCGEKACKTAVSLRKK